MNIWENTVLTTKGIALLAKLVEGNTLTITKAMSGTGFVTPGLLQNQITVTDPAQALTFRNVSYPEEGKCTVNCYLSNDELEAGYTANQIGVFAMDPEEGEILFFISQAATGTGVMIPSKAESPGYSAEWAFTFAYGQADTVEITVDPSNTVNRPQMEEYVRGAVTQAIEDMPAATVKAKLDEAETITTAGTGAAYTATVPGITALKAGVSFIMVPHVTSATNQPTLDVNGLGAKNLRQPLTSNTGATTTAAMDTWLTAGKPIRVSYDGTLWKTDIPRPSATYLYGKVPVTSGGTGADNAEEARANLGAQEQHTKVRVTLPASGWADNQQTVSAAGVLADEDLCDVITSAAPASRSAYNDAGVYCSAQGNDTLTFSCENTPESDIIVNVIILK